MDPFTDSMSDLDTLDLRLEYVAAMMKGVSQQEYRDDNILFAWQLFAGMARDKRLHRACSLSQSAIQTHPDLLQQ
jgi:hypothetical protein